MEGIRFALFKPAALIGDEMGLGKTLPAIALAKLKNAIFGFDKVLVVTLASLKKQWKREIERFAGMRADIAAGTPKQRKAIYFNHDGLFKITNNEAVLRDVTLLRRFRPDPVINNYYIDLHEEQRQMHAGDMFHLQILLNQKFLAPMDMRRIQELSPRMRMACDSTYLIDSQTNISPKLNELEGIVEELVVENGRKMVIFSEWTTMALWSSHGKNATKCSTNCAN